MSDAPDTPAADAAHSLAAVHRRLRLSGTLAELFAAASDEARTACALDRAFVVRVDGDRVTSASRPEPDDQGADARLLRLLIDRPLTITTGSDESLLVTTPTGGAVAGPRSCLADSLNLAHHGIAAIAPEDVTVALLVGDRRAAPLSDEELSLLGSLGILIAAALERLTLVTRLKNLAAELRHLTTSADALMQEALEAPVVAAAGAGTGMLFTEVRSSASARALTIFSARERAIGDLLADGHSNREIADELFLSPHTVKELVSRLARKLDASNRVQAAAQFARMRAVAEAEDS